jgi:hypothetical protein
VFSHSGNLENLRGNVAASYTITRSGQTQPEYRRRAKIDVRSRR